MSRRPEPRARIQARLKVCGEWQDWFFTTDGEIAKSIALELARLRQAEVIYPFKEYRVIDAKGRMIWPPLDAVATHLENHPDAPRRR